MAVPRGTAVFRSLKTAKKSNSIRPDRDGGRARDGISDNSSGGKIQELVVVGRNRDLRKFPKFNQVQLNHVTC